MRFPNPIVLAAALLLAVPDRACAEEFVVGQKNKEFSTTMLTIKVGDSVSFRNDDPFFHNIFSRSDTQAFDLGSYPQGKARSVRFEKAGLVEVECAIHPDMKLQVEVRPRSDSVKPPRSGGG
jgi:plastocyanin